MPSIGMIGRTFKRINAVKQCKGVALSQALMNCAQLVSYLSGVSDVTSRKFSVILKREGEDVIPCSLSLITYKRKSKKTIWLSASMGKTLYFNYGITGFIVKRNVDPNVVYDFFRSAISHKSIIPEELVPKGITLAFSDGIE